MTGSWRLVFFYGNSWQAKLIRFLTWEWWRLQPFSQVPAHVALFFWDGTQWIEIEAVVTGIRRVLLERLPTEGVVESIIVPAGAEEALTYASRHVGERYGFEAALLTGLASIPHADDYAEALWSQLGEGRTMPLHCALLAAGAVQAARFTLPKWRTPPSPNQLLRYCKERFVI